MYYYYLNGYRVENDLSISTNEDGESTYTTTKTRFPIKRVVAGTTMIRLFYDGTDVYISYSDEEGNASPDELVTQSYIDSLGSVTTTIEDEQVVGSNGGVTTQTVTRYHLNEEVPEVHAINPIEFSSVDVTIDSIAGNASFITSLNPTKTNYKLVAVVGWSISGVSTVVPFRLYIGSVSETLYIGLRNTTSTVVTDKTLTVYLMWQADNLNLENLEEEETQEELVGPSNTEEETSE